MINSNPKKIEEVLSKGVSQILPGKKGLKSLMRKRKIKLYLGIDPTSPNIHLGNAVCLRKLKEFQNLGHEIIFLIGSFTAQVGDPSERDKKRKPLTLTQIKENMTAYKKQVAKILDISKVKVKYNSNWLTKLKFKDLIALASHFTTSRLLERDMFQKRLKQGREVWLSELLYPLMQGYDSVAMNVDLEIGGTDQTFNMLVGRKLQRIYNKKEKFILTVPLLTGLDGRKMSKTYNNVVNLTDKPNEMYGKIMSLKDNLITHYFELCVGSPLAEIKKMEKMLKLKKVNPRDLKAKLAKEIVRIYYGTRAAKKAEQDFNRVFKEKKLPLKIEEIKIKEKELNILVLLLKTKKVASKSEAKRLILQRAIKIDKVLKENWREVVKIKKGSVIKIGKKKFIKII
ncbi:MAG: tyrosine--tRNA ligase [Candidatus Nealsonbacteria bacterium]|nr:MAG: tyrosine--tRNA ligase [Candidatus Nealsonbacteria bacterium]